MSKISALTELAEAPASTDEFVIVDKSDTTQAASGTTKRIQSENAFSSLVTLTGTQKITNKTISHSVQSYTPAISGTATLDCSLSNIHKITMPAGNITIALSNITVGQVIKVDITQDGVGSRTVTWFTTIRWADGVVPTLTTTLNKRDSFGFECTGTNTYDGFIMGQAI